LRGAWEIEDPFEAPTPTLIPQPSGGATRNAEPLYDVGHLDVVTHLVTAGPVRTSALRALGAHTNIFAIESIMEELAVRSGRDPVAFRIDHLSDRRAIAVIDRVTDMVEGPVGGVSATGHGLGLGFGRYKNVACYVAVVAEVIAEREVVVPRVWAAVDAGRVVNPDGVLNQIEGGIIQSVSWALKEQVPLDGGYNAARRWSDYPILRFDEIPDVSIALIDRPREMSVGVGEGAQGPTTAAIANGLRAVLGVPVRSLPFTTDNVTRMLLR
jgi:nicotinate dehydrogenase subunit B